MLIATSVFFLLPSWIAPPAIDIDTGQVTTQTTQTSRPGPAKPQTGAALSPWKQAQQLALRQETQEILAQMLQAQKNLGKEGVTVWAEKEYNQALQRAEAGDTEYGRQNFVQARDQYAQALVIFTRLLNRVDALFAETVEKGNAALSAGDAERAREAFEVALAIDPLDRAALLGMQRADTLDDVMALVNKGDALLREGQLEAARATYQQALDIDSHSARPRQQLKLSQDRIIDRRFDAAMSSGFTLLEKNRLEQAEDAFSKALKLKPGSRDARSGLNQARHLLTAANISDLLEQARQMESNEDWQGALGRYESALAIDANLANALEGKKRTSMRGKIHDRLEQILAQPTRLFDQAVFNETVRFYNKIRTISGPGPVLTGQLARLDRLLEKADTPARVRLVSDNLTRITLYKVGELGAFTSKDLSLRPGQYTAVGHRDGYRDVRVEFFVDPDKPALPVVIQSDEKIALGE